MIAAVSVSIFRHLPPSPPQTLCTGDAGTLSAYSNWRTLCHLPLLALEHLYVSHELRYIHKLLTNVHGYWLVGVFPGRWWGGTVNPSQWQKVPPRGDTVADRGPDIIPITAVMISPLLSGFIPTTMMTSQSLSSHLAPPAVNTGWPW